MSFLEVDSVGASETGTFPLVFGIVTTFCCPLQCSHCCFGCGPKRKETIDVEQTLKAIEKVSRFSDVRCVAFTGGEPFLLNRLVDLVACVTKHKVSSRVVSSGFWATDKEAARQRLQPLVDAGLKELNVSTGDSHNKFVPLEDACRAVVEGALLGLRTLIVVEHRSAGRIHKEDVLEVVKGMLKGHPQPKEPVVVIENEIVPMDYCHNHQVLPPDVLDETKKKEGCDNILLNLSMLPTGELYSCCGLTMTRIPDLRMGVLEDLLQVESRKQFLELINSNALWHLLSEEGPEGLARIVEKEIGVKIISDDMKHRCHQCLALFSHGLTRSVLRDYIERNGTLAVLKSLQKQHYINRYTTCEFSS